MTNEDIIGKYCSDFNEPKINSNGYLLPKEYIFNEVSLLSAMDAARKDEAEKYYIHSRLTKEESEKIRSYKATEVKFISDEIGVSVYCKNEKGKWIDVTDYSTW
ncbi:MAG TPA: hypothetical protein PL085_11790 [Agriterribacter sp.]|uniref:hypothetical protein n=1 Tax=Agriterribacter sp. TaxID=2821509 RepID=UPI002B8F9B01|nr:hypothetical protein [Agriterribacter sp.]HRQ17751.1 hypothetical protein [Agriterribacter sp.]